MADKTLEQLNEDIFKALTYNSGQLKMWLNELGDVDPYKALMVFDKLSGTYIKMEDLKMSASNSDNFNINILVDSERGKTLLTELLKEDNEDNTDNE
jgi:hypothetical protein